MLGNVYKWCHDGRRNYTADAVVDPMGPTGAGVARVIRGGGWFEAAQYVRAAHRHEFPPTSASAALASAARVRESVGKSMSRAGRAGQTERSTVGQADWRCEKAYGTLSAILFPKIIRP
jgi:Sulfatase-modifying factor enzyme 1